VVDEGAGVTRLEIMDSGGSGGSGGSGFRVYGCVGRREDEEEEV
jgi:hypothetical protein